MTVTIAIPQLPGDTDEAILARVLHAMSPALRAKIVGIRMYTVTTMVTSPAIRPRRLYRRETEEKPATGVSD
jgi:hypothetical protein